MADPQHKKTLKEIGNGYFRDGEYSLASAMYKKYVKQEHSDNKNAYVNWGLCAFRSEDYLQCIEVCLKAIEIDGQFCKAYYRLAQAYEKIDDQYGAFINAKKFCNYYTGSRNDPQFKEMQILVDQKKIQIVRHQPDKINSKDKLLFAQENPQTQKSPPELKAFTPHSHSIPLEEASDRQNINYLYQKVNDPCLQISEKKTTMKLIKIFKNKGSNLEGQDETQQSGCSEKNGRKEDEKEEEKQEAQKKESRKEENQKDNTNGPQLCKQKTQSIQREEKEETAKSEKSGNYFQQLFLDPLAKKADIFEGFYEILEELLSSQLNNNEKKVLLEEIAQQYDKFVPLQMSLSSKQKQSLKYGLKKSGCSVLIPSYCS